MSIAEVDILLAIYNGAKFLPEQLASLDAQTFSNWRLVVRDDGSHDDSLVIVKRWAEDHGREIKIVTDGRGNLGAKSCFEALISNSDSSYFACCDQDDVWLPQKLQIMMNYIRKAESHSNKENPILCYSDLHIVDEDLNIMASSYRRFAGVKKPAYGRELVNLLSHNVVTGCASLGNSALRKRLVPFPTEVVMHDWWMGLAAAAGGQLVWVPDATLLYRQHGRNVLGAMSWNPTAITRRLISGGLNGLQEFGAFLGASQGQARAVVRVFGHELPTETIEIVDGYGRLSEKGVLARKQFVVRHGLLKGRLTRKLASLVMF